MFTLLVKNSGEANATHAIDMFLELVSDDEACSNKKLFEQIGSFLFDVAALYVCMCKHNKVKIHDDFNKAPYKNILNADKYVKLCKEHEQAILNQDSINYILSKIKEIDLEANNILDKYHFYESDNSLNTDAYKECIVLFNIGKKENCENKLLRYRCFADKDILIIPIDERRKKEVLDEISSIIENCDTKALYYKSSDERRVLYANQTQCFGYKFIEEIHNVVNFIKTNFQTISQNELFCVTERDIKYFETDNNMFELIERKTDEYTHKIISFYTVKEKKKMNITNYTNYGTSYIIENYNAVLPELNMLQGNNEKLDLKLNEMKNAIDKKDQSKIEQCIDWLKNNAWDLIKDVGASVLADVIIKSTTM
jgi:hypothetical protein